MFGGHCWQIRSEQSGLLVWGQMIGRPEQNRRRAHWSRAQARRDEPAVVHRGACPLDARHVPADLTFVMSGSSPIADCRLYPVVLRTGVA